MSTQQKNFEQLYNSLVELLSLESLKCLSYCDLYDLYLFLSDQCRTIKLLRAKKSGDELAFAKELFKSGDSQN